MAIPRNEVSDFSVQNEGTIFLLIPHTPSAQRGINENLPSERVTLGNAVAVEHRYICDIIDGIRADGLEVR